MKKFLIVPMLSTSLISGYAIADDLDDMTYSTIHECVWITSGVKSLLGMAKLKTGLTSVGTVASGVALGAGIKEDNLIKDNQKSIEDEIIEEEDIEYFDPPLKVNCDEIIDGDDWELSYEKTENGGQEAVCLVKSRNNKLKREMTAGGDSADKKIETANKVKGVAGTVSYFANGLNVGLGLTSRSNGFTEMKQAKESCPAAIKEVSDMVLRNKVEGTSEAGAIERAQRIIDACRDLENVDWKKIDNPAIWSAVASGVAVGTVIGSKAADTNASIASDFEQKQQANKTGNALLGVSAVAGATATVLNAAQIAAVKRVANISEKCEKVMMEVAREIEKGDEDDDYDDEDEGGAKHISIKRK